MTAISPHKSVSGWTRIWRACLYSMQGFKSAYQHESAFRQELALAAVLTPIAVFAPIAYLAKALLLGSVMLILVTELLNSAIETVVDRISLDAHDLSKRAKDFGSAAVFLSLCNCALIWGLVLIDTLAR